MDTFATLIITAADAPISCAIAAAFGSGGVGMWTTPLSASGSGPATHYISSGFIPSEYVGLSSMTEWALVNGSWTVASSRSGDAATVALYASQAGVNVTAAEVEAIFGRSDVSAQEPFVAMGRLGLSLIAGSGL